MKIVCISDTHDLHHKVKYHDADMLLIAGDISSMGKEYQVVNFIKYIEKLNYKHKVMIAGNHDFVFENNDINGLLKFIEESGIIYLNDNSTTIENIKIYGSPISPWFHNWAFNRQRGDEIQKYWDMIPNNTDILLTHTPPYGILDINKQYENCGCKNLLQTVYEIKPKYHIFGHIHESYGQVCYDNIKFINASVLNEKYQYVNQPIVFEYNYD
jgi:Icc-related predicted phosphoesterase